MLRRAPWLLVVTLAFAAPASAAEVDKYLLDDTDAVLGLNVRLLLESPLVKKHYLPLAQGILSKPEVASQFRDYGIDPLKDVDRVLLVHGDSCHRSVDGKEQISPLVIVRGRFDLVKFSAKTAQLAQFAPQLVQLQRTPSGGTLYEVTLEKTTLFIAMPDRTTLVGSLFKEAVSDALDKGTGKKKTHLKHYGMRFLIEQADYKNALWAAALGRAAIGGESPLPVSKGKKVESGARQKLSDSGVREVSGGITVADGIKVALRIKVEDPETAKTVSDALNQFLPQLGAKDFDGKLADKKAAPARELLRSLAVAAEDNDLIVQGSVPGKVIVDSLK